MNEKRIAENGIFYILNEAESTAYVTYSPKARKNVKIQRSIVYQEREYLITCIKEGSFAYNKSIKSITFSDDSALLTIEKNSFKSSKIEYLFLPASVQELKEGWCNKTPHLNYIEISPQNPHFKYIDDNHQIIVRKSATDTENFDVLHFASRNIDRVIIPSSIAYIDSYSFNFCKNLQTIEISENSNLLSIGKNCFSNTKIRSLFFPSHLQELKEGWCKNTIFLNHIEISKQNSNFQYIDCDRQIIVGKSDNDNKENFDVIYFASRDITYAIIPSSIKHINSCSFDFCWKLELVEFSENSELLSIGKRAFTNTHIKKFYIPSNVEELKEGWLYNAYYLRQISLSPKNKNFRYLDENRHIIIGKSDKKNQEYDVIVCSNGFDHETSLFIPSSIKKINSFAFMCNSNITHVNFEWNSHLQWIGKNAFYSTDIKDIEIPKEVFIHCPNTSST